MNRLQRRTAPSYAYSAFVKADPGVAVTAGRIKGLKEIQLAGTREYEVCVCMFDPSFLLPSFFSVH